MSFGAVHHHVGFFFIFLIVPFSSFFRYMEKGSHVGQCRNTKEDDNVLGTLLVQLPSIFSGGSMRVIVKIQRDSAHLGVYPVMLNSRAISSVITQTVTMKSRRSILDLEFYYVILFAIKMERACPQQVYFKDQCHHSKRLCECYLPRTGSF
mmetsp:Transcript_39971/g.86176  ORF Transcript_39971/g.86176 Transcript_39971/m.86176 type:complete len:151 (-) Transcript_39971:61-513(-)